MRILTKLRGLFQKAPSTKVRVADNMSHDMSFAQAHNEENVDSYESNHQMGDENDPYHESFPLYILQNSKDYGWKKVPYKHVILTNPKELIGRVSGEGLMAQWHGTGHAEWEAILALIFIQYVREAEKNDLDEIDITDLFSHDLKASNNRKMSADDVRKHISKSFKVVEETQDLIRVSFTA